MQSKIFAAAVLVAFMLTAVAEASELELADHLTQQQEQQLNPIHYSRKLQQRNWYYNRGRDRGNTGDLQLARNNAAIVNSQYAIRTAVESGAAPGVTRGATLYSADQAWQAAQRIGPYPYGSRWGYYWYGGKRRS